MNAGWKWWKCLIKYGPEMENVIGFSTRSPRGFLGVLVESQPWGWQCFPVLSLAGDTAGCHCPKEPEPGEWQETPPQPPQCQWLLQGTALLIISSPGLIVLLQWSLMKIWFPFGAWICHLCDSDLYHRSLMTEIGKSSKLEFIFLVIFF